MTFFIGKNDMPLITCKDCQKEFSTDARRCPHCGANKAKKPSGVIEFIKWFCIFALLNGFFNAILFAGAGTNAVMAAPLGTLAAIGLTFYARSYYKKKNTPTTDTTASQVQSTSSNTKISFKLFLFVIGAGCIISFIATAKNNSTSNPPQISAEHDQDDNKQAASRITMAALYAGTVKQDLRDPSSLQWAYIGTNKDASVVCLQYRARNGFGGMNLENIAVAKGKTSRDAAFWNKYCTKSMYNVTSTVADLVNAQ